MLAAAFGHVIDHRRSCVLDGVSLKVVPELPTRCRTCQRRLNSFGSHATATSFFFFSSSLCFSDPSHSCAIFTLVTMPKCTNLTFVRLIASATNEIVMAVFGLLMVVLESGKRA